MFSFLGLFAESTILGGTDLEFYDVQIVILLMTRRAIFVVCCSRFRNLVGIQWKFSVCVGMPTDTDRFCIPCIRNPLCAVWSSMVNFTLPLVGKATGNKFPIAVQGNSGICLKPC